MKMNTALKYLAGAAGTLILLNCSAQKESDAALSFSDMGRQAVYAAVRPEVIEEKDTFNAGEEIAAKVFLNRTDYKALAQQAGIRDYLKVYYFHGDHAVGDDLSAFTEASVEFDTAYLKFKPKPLDFQYDYLAYPYDVVVQVDYDDEREGADTTFIWRQEALIKK